MKICPTCRKTYTDDGLNFCLEDGSLLTVANNVPPETLIMNQAPPTTPNQAFGSQPGIQSTFGNQSPQQYSMQPQKSSKTWIWVLGILGVLVVVCGGGGVLSLIMIGASVDNNSNRAGNPTPQTSKSPGSTPKTSPFPDGESQKVDLSEWVKEFSPYGTTEFKDGEFIMGSKQKAFYYVLVAPAEYSTDGATTKVTARNISDATTSLGFGLIFHSDPTPLTKDYALIIDSKKKRYRVVRHEPSKELPVVTWTPSMAIKDGTQENVLEARDKGDKIELYINDQMVTSIKNTYGYKGGVAGLYSGDGAKIGFKNLEISK